MKSMSLYRGNLHRVSDAPREWPMPPRKITLEQFKILTHKRALALARLAAQNNPNPNEIIEEKNEPPEIKHEEPQEEGELTTCSVSDPQPIQVDQAPKEPEDCKMTDADADADAGAIANSTDDPSLDVKMEVNNNLDTLSDKEKRKIELEQKLQVLKEKKHNLVQMLKQILGAEEEIKRRNAQSAALRSSVPLQSETAVDMGSATRLVPKLSVEVNFSGELGGESDATANHSTQARQRLLSTSSTASLSRPFQQNELLPTPKSTLGNSGHGQTQAPPNSTSVGNAAAAAAASPSRFVPNGHQSHHHSASLPPVSGSGSHFMVSSPSPAASGGASSVFKDSRLTTSS